MPVYRYRTHEEAHRARWLEPGDPRIAQRMYFVLDLSRGLYPRARPPGVHRFRTLEEAAVWRASWPPARR